MQVVCEHQKLPFLSHIVPAAEVSPGAGMERRNDAPPREKCLTRRYNSVGVLFFFSVV